MTGLDPELIVKILRQAMDRIDGDWVLVGGSLLVAQGVSDRATVDIDLVGFSNPTQKDTLILMEIASENGVPIEALNQAASYFVLKIPDARSHLEPWIEGRKGRLFQPDLYLYVCTKLGRLSETDVRDASAWIRDRRAVASADCIRDTLARIDDELAATNDPLRKTRLEAVRAAFEGD